MNEHKKNEIACVCGWPATALAVVAYALYCAAKRMPLWALAALMLVGCSSAVVKRDAELSKNFALCDSEAKAIARFSSACSQAVTQLLDLMAQPECKDFPSGPVDGGLTIGGVTYICHEEAPRGK